MRDVDLLRPIRVAPDAEQLAWAALVETTYGISPPEWSQGFIRRVELSRDKTWTLLDNFLRPVGRDLIVASEKYATRVDNDKSLDDAVSEAGEAVDSVQMALEAQIKRLCEATGGVELIQGAERFRNIPYLSSESRRLLDTFVAADQAYCAIELGRRERVLDTTASRAEGKAIWTLYQELQVKVSTIRHEMAKRMAERPNAPAYFLRS